MDKHLIFEGEVKISGDLQNIVVFSELNSASEVHYFVKKENEIIEISHDSESDIWKDKENKFPELAKVSGQLIEDFYEE